MSLVRILVSMRGLFVMGVLLATVSACGSSPEQLRSRAAFDLRCPSDQLAISDIDGRAKSVTGCGSFATYVRSCKEGTNPGRGDNGCWWAMNHAGEKMD